MRCRTLTTRACGRIISSGGMYSQPYLREAGFEFHEPEGAYYIMADIAGFGTSMDDTEFVRWMIQNVGVAGVPGSSFYFPRERGHTKVRFMFAKREETLHQAGQKLLDLRRKLPNT